MIHLILTITAIIFFSFRAHTQEVRANQLEVELENCKQNEIHLVCELSKAKQELRVIQANRNSDTPC